MKCLRIEPKKKPEVVDIPNDLKSFQKEVGGYIEVIYPFTDMVGIICNEEGKLLNLPENRILRDSHGIPYDVICGNFLVVGLDEDDFIDLSDKYIKKYSKIFADEMWKDGEIPHPPFLTA